METAEASKTNGKVGQQIEALDVAGRLTLRKLEMTVGKKMSVNVNLKTQEDLSDTAAMMRSLPADKRAELDRALDLLDQLGQGNVLPAVALSSIRVNE